MTIPLFSLPEHIRNSTIQKLGLRDFVKFHQSSRKSFDSAKNLKSRFLVSSELKGKPVTFWVKYTNEGILMHLYYLEGRRTQEFPDLFGSKSVYITDFPLRFDANVVHIEGTLLPEFCAHLTNLFLYTNSSASYLTFSEIICSQEALSRLINAAKHAIRMEFNTTVPLSFMKMDCIKNAVELGINAPLKDEDFLILKTPYLFLLETVITSKGINSFLKDAIEGRRIVDLVGIHTYCEMDEAAILEDIPVTARGNFDGKSYCEFGENDEYIIQIQHDRVGIRKRDRLRDNVYVLR